jgi:hypothetical protein
MKNIQVRLNRGYFGIIGLVAVYSNISLVCYEPNLSRVNLAVGRQLIEDVSWYLVDYGLPSCSVYDILVIHMLVSRCQGVKEVLVHPSGIALMLCRVDDPL